MPKIKKKHKVEFYDRCKICGDEIYWNTHKKMVYCRCEALAIDGCEFYIRVIGDEKNHEIIRK